MSSLIPHFMPRSLRELGTDRRGVTAIEYGLLAGLIAVVLVGILTTLGGDLKTLFTTIDTDVNTANAPG